MIDEPSICRHIWEAIGAVFRDVVHVESTAFTAAIVVVELFAFGLGECCQTLDGASNGSRSSCCSICGVGSGIGRPVVVVATLGCVLASVKHFLSDFPSAFQIGLAVFIMAFDF